MKANSAAPNKNPIAHHFRLDKPCSNCPFKKQGAINLAEERLDSIIDDLINNDTKTFFCHKHVHSSKGGDFDEDGNYMKSGDEPMCAGAAAYLMKVRRPTVGMRLAFATGDLSISSLEKNFDSVIEPRGKDAQFI